MKEVSKDLLRLTHIIESISTVEGYFKGLSYEIFSTNEMLQSASIRHLEIIGEAASKVSGDLKRQHTEIQWREIIALRNFVAHEYYKIDSGQIWSTIKDDLPILKSQVIAIIEEIK